LDQWSKEELTYYARGDQRVAGCDLTETVHILSQLDRELEAELRERNQMGKFADKAKHVTDVIKETEDTLVAQLDGVLEKLQKDIPAQATVAFAKAGAVVGELQKGVEDFSTGLQILSNSAGNSEAESEGSSDPQKQQ
jgi:hypothetical protein